MNKISDLNTRINIIIPKEFKNKSFNNLVITILKTLFLHSIIEYLFIYL